MSASFQGWSIFICYRNAPGGFLFPSVHRTRREAIAGYERVYIEPGQYARDRRKGQVLAVRVTVTMDTGQ